MDALRALFVTMFSLAALGTVASLCMRDFTIQKDLARRQSQSMSTILGCSQHLVIFS